MRQLRKLALKLAFMSFFSIPTSATASTNFILPMQTVAYSLAWLMMVVLGIKWIVSDSDNERNDAKKGMMYVMVAILVVASLCSLMCIYCLAAQQSMSAAGLTYDCQMGNIFCPNCP
jgi:hypothetical protein